jgi:hypothetical protein
MSCVAGVLYGPAPDFSLSEVLDLWRGVAPILD